MLPDVHSLILQVSLLVTEHSDQYLAHLRTISHLCITLLYHQLAHAHGSSLTHQLNISLTHYFNQQCVHTRMNSVTLSLTLKQLVSLVHNVFQSHSPKTSRIHPQSHHYSASAALPSTTK
jgi:hypothetical protein